ncbi:alkane 1-monooxygenase [Salinispira pacifica]|uniref:Alkane-1 monooxygenase n=1 Tax=Salinispira pacifica TaxID=1307761 RepID=V5WN71_9SPIO|nr:alkane 1-monooxygenase [Salinispira pacifica]AHC16649.1 Alkane-1 monooxygenase [Salinispira pacifica]
MNQDQSEQTKPRLRALHAVPFFIGYSLLPLYWLFPGGWSVAVFVFVLIPVFDVIFGKSSVNFTSPRIPRAFDVLIWLWPFLQMGNLVAALIMLQTAGGNVWFFTGHILSLGIINGAVGITYAHELIHRKSRAENFLGEIILSTVWYLHWKVEHVRGHHAFVATPKDPASAPLGSTIYSFIPKSFFGGWKSTAALESERLKRKGLPPISLRNYLWSAALIPSVFTAAVGLLIGFKAMLIFLLQALVAIILLEIVNYIEHYGLRRKQLESGNYERPHPGISWNADNRLTNAFLINLQRHSDHHARPRVQYPMLESRKDAPQLPFGYATMILAALIPPLYKRIVEPRIPPD